MRLRRIVGVLAIAAAAAVAAGCEQIFQIENVNIFVQDSLGAWVPQPQDSLPKADDERLGD